MRNDGELSSQDGCPTQLTPVFAFVFSLLATNAKDKLSPCLLKRPVQATDKQFPLKVYRCGAKGMSSVCRDSRPICALATGATLQDQLRCAAPLLLNEIPFAPPSDQRLATELRTSDKTASDDCRCCPPQPLQHFQNQRRRANSDCRPRNSASLQNLRISRDRTPAPRYPAGWKRATVKDKTTTQTDHQRRDDKTA